MGRDASPGFRALRLPITVAYGVGAYTARILVGSERLPQNVLLDTGSASFALKMDRYDPGKDQWLRPMSLVQDVTYGAGAWAGPVVQTCAEFQDVCGHRLSVDDVPMALMEADAENLYHADGILGLAFSPLDPAYDVSAYLEERGIRPPMSYPWCFQTTQNLSLIRQAKTKLQAFPRQEVTPFFTLAESRGLVVNRFATFTQRAIVHAAPGADMASMLKDPVNQGWLILGGTQDPADLFEGGFQTLQISHDVYYNTHLKSLQVQGFDPFSAPELSPEEMAKHISNSFFDTGSSFVVLPGPLYDTVMAQLEGLNPSFGDAIRRFQQRFQSMNGIDTETLDLSLWPDLFFTFAGERGEDVGLTLSPSAYWQMNAMHAGQAFFVLMRGLASFPNQSILGLPMFQGRYCVFDRSQDGLGVIRVARGAPHGCR